MRIKRLERPYVQLRLIRLSSSAHGNEVGVPTGYIVRISHFESDGTVVSGGKAGIPESIVMEICPECVCVAPVIRENVFIKEYGWRHPISVDGTG
ncbi:hypothetical protein SDC9_183114 [bioreactor metagenome]|uniref:Uncharacterized protein n=1 Tax=bioreactor metagenome TaxID=1076179 RepID=A0A645HAS3_9ZZZZ